MRQYLHVEKQELIGILQQFTDTSAEQANAIASLENEYPFSQLLKVLTARASHDHAWQNKQELLQKAAVYSTDRTVLKKVMTATVEPDTTPAITKPIITTTNSLRAEEDFDTVAETVIADLQRLSELKHNFEAVADGIELPEPEATTHDESKRKPGRPKKKKVSNDPLIEEIKVSKKKVDPESEKTKEQIEIITQFIRTQPTIAPREKSDVPAGDLSTVKSGDFGDNIISETLVEILLKQGKKEKAIEVLKKLIWKFPQKKAYFATRIEELKN